MEWEGRLPTVVQATDAVEPSMEMMNSMDKVHTDEEDDDLENTNIHIPAVLLCVFFCLIVCCISFVSLCYHSYHY